MPLLPAEPNRYPPTLFAGGAAAPGAWWVLHTKPRQEKSLARDLTAARVPFYLPLLERRLVVRGKPARSLVPLFPGYVFLRGGREERVAALATRRVVLGLEVYDQDGLDRDLSQVERLLASGAPVTPVDRLAPGDLVEVAGGPLAGLKGRVVRAAGARRFVVAVDFIQRGASVLLDDCHLEVVRPAAVRA